MLQTELKFSTLKECNELRQHLLHDVRNVAPTKITVLQNDTPLMNEVISDRIELTPFRVKKHSKDNVKYLFKLDVTAKENIRHVTCLDFVSDQKECLPVSQFPKTEINKNGGVLICTLRKGQRLNVEFEVEYGFSRDHTKFSPVILAIFNETKKKDIYLFSVETNGSMTPEEVMDQFSS